MLLATLTTNVRICDGALLTAHYSLFIFYIFSNDLAQQKCWTAKWKSICREAKKRWIPLILLVQRPKAKCHPTYEHLHHPSSMKRSAVWTRVYVSERNPFCYQNLVCEINYLQKLHDFEIYHSKQICALFKESDKICRRRYKL